MQETGAPNVKKRSYGGILASFLTLIITLLVCLAILEGAARYLMGFPLTTTENFRETQVVESDFHGGIFPHETLGWQMKPNMVSDGFNTIEHGIRKNDKDTKLVTGGILAVGDSFTAGSEVDDWESWPAYLEKLTNTPVVNGGVGGYGTDQILSRAEELLPIVKPKTLVVGFLQDDILRSAYSRYGWPKPYYDVKDGELIFHPASNEAPDGGIHIFSFDVSSAIRSVGGYSALAHGVAMRLVPEYWLSSRGHSYTRVSIDAVEVTCALMRRVKKKTDELGVRMLLFMQYGGGHHSTFAARTGHAQLVIDCAEANGIQVVDELDSLQAIAKENLSDLRDYYVMQGDTYGHMSATGNKHAADLLQEALLQDFEPRNIEGPSGSEVSANDMPKLDALETRIQGSPIVGVEKSDFLIWKHHTLTATGPKGEHYVGIGGIESPPGVTNFSMLVRMNSGTASIDKNTKFRVQIWDSEGQGIFADFNLNTQETGMTRMGLARKLSATIEEDGWWGWKRITMSAQFSGHGRTIYLQILDADGNSAIDAEGRAFDVSDLKLY